MKKILFAAVAALAITSCSQNEEFDGKEQNSLIKVGTVVKNSPRATVVDNGGFNSFRVTSYIVDASQVYTTTKLGSPYMSEVQFDKSGSWSQITAGEYYWPTTKNVQFFGYPTEGVTFNSPTDTGYPTLGFEIAAISADQKDVVVAAGASVKKPAGDAAAMLQFFHILTKISFSYKAESAAFDYKINSITISGVMGGNATYTFAEDVTKGEWGNGDAVATSYICTVNHTAETGPTAYTPLTLVGGPLMLLPQDLTTAKISIDYTTTDKRNADIGFTGSKEVDITGKWGVGKGICYQLTLPVGVGTIKVEGNANDWADGSTDAGTVQ